MTMAEHDAILDATQAECVAEMKLIIPKLNKASEAYYQLCEEIMSNYEYDELYDKLLQLEKESGIVLPESPTQTVGYKIISNLERVKHPSPMLSLDKTKDVQVLKAWLKNKLGFLSWKEDGLTVVLTYENGELVSAVTRGDGITGEIITENAKHFYGVPHTINFYGRMVIRGEAVITRSTFKRFENEYKNPRNLVSGTVRQLNTRITAGRHVEFVPFNVIELDGYDENSYSARLEFIKQFGFTPVFGKLVTADTLEETVKWFEKEIVNNDIPSDGLVLMFDDIAYGESLGVTAKFPRNGLAFKWKDETAETVLRAVRWQASRTGRLNPVAEFDPVELEGTTVSRASVNNVSFLRNLKLNEGDTLHVIKANMIIPQIVKNLTGQQLDENLIPKLCPVCGKPTTRKIDNLTVVLFCENPDCAAKQIGKFEHFVSRKCMNIMGLSTATLETFIENGYITNFPDIYYLDSYRDEIINLEGFGEKSYEKIISSIEASKKTTFNRFVASLGIPNVSNDTAKLIVADMTEVGRLCSEVFLEYIDNPAKLTAINGIGDVVANNLVKWFAENRQLYFDVLKELDIEDDVIQAKVASNSGIAGKTFVITGTVEHFANRNALKDFVESKGGKVAGSVTSKTDYLINNDVLSNSGKNKKAKELNIPIISEQDFLALV